MHPELSDLFNTPMTLEQYLASVERSIIIDELMRSNFNRAAVARTLGINYRAMRYRFQRLGEFSDKLIVSPRSWSKLRMHVLNKYGRKCQCCGATPESGAVLNVDHIKSRDRYPHLAFNEENLQVLCAECNRGKGDNEIDFRMK